VFSREQSRFLTDRSNEDELHSFHFDDGLDRLSGLSMFKVLYEMAFAALQASQSPLSIIFEVISAMLSTDVATTPERRSTIATSLLDRPIKIKR
jgi:hypothetical protein